MEGPTAEVPPFGQLHGYYGGRLFLLLIAYSPKIIVSMLVYTFQYWVRAHR